MAQVPKDLPASVHKRLLNRARTDGRPFNELLQHYAIERLIYRLAISRHREVFVLKGATMLRVWKAPVARPTKDVDLLGRTSNDLNHIAELVRDICMVEVVPDGLRFDEASIQAGPIAEDADYSGVRVRLLAYLGTARISLQIDVGFGDTITPEAEEVELTPILDFPPPQLLGYTRETSIAEKLQVLVKLGVLSSRMKDLYDIWLLSRSFAFDGRVLALAVKTTFAKRDTAVTPRPFAFTEAYASDKDKQTQWRAFLRKSRLSDAPEDLAELMAAVGVFVSPVLASLAQDSEWAKVWPPAGPWD